VQRVARRYAPPIIRGTGAARLREGLRGAHRQWHLKDVQRVSNRGVIADDRPEFDDPLLAEPRDRLAKGGLGKALGIDQLGKARWTRTWSLAVKLGVSPVRMASIAAAGTPASTASGAWACHS